MISVSINREHSEEVKFDIDPNYRTAILGENGIGKSTILKKIVGEEKEELWCSTEVPSNLKISYFSQIEKNNNNISGGEHTKKRLEKLFAEKADIYVLDEPTNNLDDKNIDWLKDYIIHNKIKIIFTSHDIDFIDKIAEFIFYLDSQTVEKSKQKCSQFLIDRKVRIEKEFADYELNLKTYRRLEKATEHAKKEFEEGVKWENEDKGLQGFKREQAAKFGGKTIKRLTKRTESVDIEKPKNDPVPKIILHSGKAVKTILEYASTSLSGKKIDFKIASGDKVILSGDNGSGKTTLIKKIVSYLDSGQASASEFFYRQSGLKNLYLSQNWYEELDEEVVMDYLQKIFTEKEEAYKAIAYNNLKTNILERKFKDISPGIRIKIMLGVLSRQQYDLIIWDEPTNHLDVMTQIVLNEAFIKYEGGLLIVTHDKKLVGNEKFIKIQF
jgi:ATPase subunit of ABC transporter with duplicated ATPase domains